MEKLPQQQNNSGDLDLSATINSITEKEWDDVRAMVVALVQEKAFNKDPIKCTVHAFIEWLIRSDYSLIIEQINHATEKNSTIH